MFLFQEYSFLDEGLKYDIERYCVARGWIPFIDYDPELKSWIFHSITSGDLIWKKPIAKKYEAISESRGLSEAKLEKEFSEYLKSIGVNVRTQVRCRAGIADIVTDQRIYELKCTLNRATFFQALGQVLLYRGCINPQAKSVLVCRTSVVPELHTVATRLGVEVLVWTNSCSFSDQEPFSG